MAEANQPIVIDNGSGVIKAGFAGADKPRCVLRNCVGRVKHPRVMPGGALETPSREDLFIGSRAEEHRGALLLSHPMESGMVQNWAEMERVWSFLYSKEQLNVPSEEHAVLLTEPALHAQTQRVRAAEIFFEALNAPALYCGVQGVLSLYASGRTTGVVLDCGESVSQVVPVYEGLALPHAVLRMDVAGRAVSRQLQLLLRRASGLALHTSAEMEIVREMKEQHAFVALNPAQMEDAHAHSIAHSHSHARSGSAGASTSVSASVSVSASDASSVRQTHRLPDGSLVDLGPELFRAPEVLFQPSLAGYEHRGVHDLLVQSIAKSDLDLRRVLLSQVVLAGGCTLLPGFGERLLHEVRRHALAPREAKIRIAAPPERVYSAWIGGSILASLSTFKSMWVSRKEYQEQGARVFANKSL